MAHYIVFGDSIGLGFNDPEGGWVKKLSQEFKVNNLSIDGATTATFLTNFPATIDSQSIIIIALGINDSILIPFNQFQHNLIQLIKLAKKHIVKVICVGPTPVDQSKVDPIPWLREFSYKNATIKQYSEGMKLICDQGKIKFIDLFNNLKSDYINCLDDGVHPNHAGHQKIFALVQEFIK